jgi:hypothetical protein
MVRLGFAVLIRMRPSNRPRTEILIQACLTPSFTLAARPLLGWESNRFPNVVNDERKYPLRPDRGPW